MTCLAIQRGRLFSGSVDSTIKVYKCSITCIIDKKSTLLSVLIVGVAIMMMYHIGTIFFRLTFFGCFILLFFCYQNTNHHTSCTLLCCIIAATIIHIQYR